VNRRSGVGARIIRLAGMKLTEEEARRAGVLPEQLLAGRKAHLKVLEKHGLTWTQEYRAMKAGLQFLDR